MGSVAMGTASSPRTPKPCGIPGCIATLTNSTVPILDRTALTVS